MLHLFERDPQQVRWELASLESGSCRLVVHHSQGTIVETFASTEQALRRVQQLEDYLDHARVPPHAKANAARATIQQTRAVSIESPLGNRDECPRAPDRDRPYIDPAPCKAQAVESVPLHSHVRLTGSFQPRSATSCRPNSSCVVGIVSAGRLSRGRPPALETGQSTTPTANTRRHVRHRQRDRHGSKFALRFHQGRRQLTESTVPHRGQATSKAVRRAKVRREPWLRDNLLK
jgi:hypothetical protein